MKRRNSILSKISKRNNISYKDAVSHMKSASVKRKLSLISQEGERSDFTEEKEEPS